MIRMPRTGKEMIFTAGPQGKRWPLSSRHSVLGQTAGRAIGDDPSEPDATKRSAKMRRHIDAVLGTTAERDEQSREQRRHENAHGVELQSGPEARIRFDAETDDNGRCKQSQDASGGANSNDVRRVDEKGK